MFNNDYPAPDAPHKLEQIMRCAEDGHEWVIDRTSKVWTCRNCPIAVTPDMLAASSAEDFRRLAEESL